MSPWLRAASASEVTASQTSLETKGLEKEAVEAIPCVQHTSPSRLRSPWACSLLTLLTSACSIVFLATIVNSFLTLQKDPKGCAMSFMMPSFSRYSDFDTEHTRFASKYSLYLYREGGVDLDTRVKGIPVLFIPGNAGSYKQVRPIAAEAAHHFHDVLREDGSAIANGKRPMDFFSVDFNEDITAFHGQTLLDQAEYLNEAIAYILALYHNPQRSLREPGLPDPKSVIIIGHSMGGIVARTMLRMPNYQQHSINTIVTLSAPHARAPVSFDSQMVSTYNDINAFWRRSYSELSASKNPLSDVTLVSVAGGGLDTMVASEHTSLTSIVPETHGFTVFTSGIPFVWTGMDHLAIMWCDQLRKALVKGLFDIADARRSSQTRPQIDRVRVLRKRLLTGMEPIMEKALPTAAKSTLLTLPDLQGSMVKEERLTLRTLGAGHQGKAFLMPIPTGSTFENAKFTFLTNQRLGFGEEVGSLTVLVCDRSTSHVVPGASSYLHNIDLSARTASSARLACKNAAEDVIMLPASTNESRNAFDALPPFSYLQLDLSSLQDHEYVAVVDRNVEPSTGWAIAEFKTESESTVAVSKGHHQLLLSGLHLALPAERAMMTEIKIPEVTSTLFAYNFEIKRRSCDLHEEKFAPLLRQYIAEPYESKYFVNTKGGNINVHGISPYMPPPLSGGGASEGLSLQLWTDPSCNSTVDVSLRVDVIGSAGKLVMRYRTVFAAFPLLVVAIVLRKQFKIYDATGVFMSFSESMDQCLRTSLPTIFTALTFLAVALSKATQRPWTRSLLSKTTHSTPLDIDFTMNDLMLGTSDPFFWFLVPLFGLVSVGVCISLNYVTLIITHMITFVYSTIRAFVQKNDEERKTSIAFAVTSTTHRVFTLGTLLLLAATVIPYQFVYMVLCLAQLGTAIRALHLAQATRSGQNYNFYNYVHSMLVFMLWILPINLPILIVWVHNLLVQWLTPFSTHHNLLSVLPYILLVETMSTGHMLPRVQSRLRHFTNTLIFVFALYAAIYGVTYAYRLHHIGNALCAWLFFIHCSNQGPLSLAKLAQYATGSAHTKKRP
ncbi:PGAP1-domain-containing protein [Polychaeton citri CBS 116435]|uniref:GPI inositol-deacylase n=1 Tax=Polychaeton citri CBS 116435 TaxID=1314669 RepID=A0A9P4Q6H0_9PEZI|nr:PGAP1-domain-containing protein [Polychaeton citri CBS 116435]